MAGLLMASWRAMFLPFKCTIRACVMIDMCGLNGEYVYGLALSRD